MLLRTGMYLRAYTFRPRQLCAACVVRMLDRGFTRSDYIWSRMVITEYLKGSAMLANAKETYLVIVGCSFVL